MSFSDHAAAELEHGIYPPSPQHVFCAGRCLHCGTDDHSLPGPGEDRADWEKPCPVDGEDRQSSWSFGPGAIDVSELSDEELDRLPHHSPLF